MFSSSCTFLYEDDFTTDLLFHSAPTFERIAPAIRITWINTLAWSTWMIISVIRLVSYSLGRDYYSCSPCPGTWRGYQTRDPVPPHHTWPPQGNCCIFSECAQTCLGTPAPSLTFGLRYTWGCRTLLLGRARAVYAQFVFVPMPWAACTVLILRLDRFLLWVKYQHQSKNLSQCVVHTIQIIIQSWIWTEYTVDSSTVILSL